DTGQRGGQGGPRGLPGPRGGGAAPDPSPARGGATGGAGLRPRPRAGRGSGRPARGQAGTAYRPPGAQGLRRIRRGGGGRSRGRGAAGATVRGRGRPWRPCSAPRPPHRRPAVFPGRGAPGTSGFRRGYGEGL
ncbi:MAG: hypothetical protein AVDCRST_MAG03-694, partial [uncultured Rubrobacteraceae bacterium]